MTWTVNIPSASCPHRIPLHNDVLNKRVVYCGKLYPKCAICNIHICPITATNDTIKERSHGRQVEERSLPHGFRRNGDAIVNSARVGERDKADHDLEVLIRGVLKRIGPCKNLSKGTSTALPGIVVVGGHTELSNTPHILIKERSNED